MTRLYPLTLSALLAVLVSAAAPAAWGAASPRLGLKVLPGTGAVIPHQQISDYRASIPLGLGLELFFSPRFSLGLDLSTSWHGGGPGGSSDNHLSSLQIFGRYWFDPLGRWTPFIQAGVGGYQAEIDEGQGEQQFGGVGGHIGGGVEVPIWREFYAQAEARSNWVNGEETSEQREKWIGHTQLLLWLVYKLP